MNAIKTNTIRVSARNNPFAVQRTDAIPFDFGETPFDNLESFYRHVKQFGFRGAIVGKHGRGKTTLLCDFHSFLCQKGTDSELVFIPRDKVLQYQAIKDAVKSGFGGSIVLIDGLERLSFFTRQRLLSRSRSFGGFIATTHRISRLRKLIHCSTSEQTLASVLHSLSLSQPEITNMSVHLFSKHRGNIRFILRDLYDQFADGKLSCNRALNLKRHIEN